MILTNASCGGRFDPPETGISHHLILAGFLLTIASGAVLHAQDPSADALQTAVVTAFNEGDAEMLFRTAAQQLDISVVGSSGLFSRAQATHVLERFFADYPPGGFILTEATDSDGRRLLLGDYAVQNSDDRFHVYVYLRIRNDAWEVKEVRIVGTESTPES